MKRSAVRGADVAACVEMWQLPRVVMDGRREREMSVAAGAEC